MKKRKEIIPILFLLAFFSVSTVFAAVVINEAEINPAGSDTGAEWIEIFNIGSEENLSGWYINTAGGLNHSLDNVTLNGNSFYIKQGFTPSIADASQNLKLFDNTNSLIDQTGIFTDNGNNGSTYSRMPDVTGSFVFQAATKNASNQPTLIQNKTSSPSCILNGNNVRLNVNVSGFCIEEVIFSGLIKFFGLFSIPVKLVHLPFITRVNITSSMQDPLTLTFKLTLFPFKIHEGELVLF